MARIKCKYVATVEISSETSYTGKTPLSVCKKRLEERLTSVLKEIIQQESDDDISIKVRPIFVGICGVKGGGDDSGNL